MTDKDILEQISLLLAQRNDISEIPTQSVKKSRKELDKEMQARILADLISHNQKKKAK